MTFGYGVVHQLGLISCFVNLDVKDLGFYARAHRMLFRLRHSTVEIVRCFPRDGGGSNETFLSFFRLQRPLWLFWTDFWLALILSMFSWCMSSICLGIYRSWTSALAHSDQSLSHTFPIVFDGVDHQWTPLCWSWTTDGFHDLSLSFSFRWEIASGLFRFRSGVDPGRFGSVLSFLVPVELRPFKPLSFPAFPRPRADEDRPSSSPLCPSPSSL